VAWKAILWQGSLHIGTQMAALWQTATIPGLIAMYHDE
jgi:hypothetical protein